MSNKFRAIAAAVLVTGTLGLPASAASADSPQIPFKASFSGAADQTSAYTIDFAGTGTASQLGRISNRGHVDVTGLANGCDGGVTAVNTETLTAADGAILSVTSHDVTCLTGPRQYHGTGHWTVTGGTGRFAHTTGEGSFDGIADLGAGSFTITLT